MNPLFNLLAGPVFEVIGKLIDRLIPDPAEKAKAQMELLKLQKDAEMEYLKAETQLATGQLEVNKAEASSGNWYAAGWRPTVGYVAIIALAYNFIAYPALQWYIAMEKLTVTPPPMLDTTQLFTLLMGMLGLGGMRSFEKYKGVAR